MSTIDQITEIAAKHGARTKPVTIHGHDTIEITHHAIAEAPVENYPDEITIWVYDQPVNGGKWVGRPDRILTAEQAIEYFERALAPRKPRTGRRVPSWAR